MIKYFSQMHKAEDGVPAPGQEAPGFKEENQDATTELDSLDETEETPGTEEQPSELDDTAKDTVKFNIWAERTAKQAGYTVEIVPSASNRAVKVNIDDSTDIVTQKDAIKLAVMLDENDMGWQLMDDPIVKSGGAWTIKMSRSDA